MYVEPISELSAVTTYSKQLTKYPPNELFAGKYGKEAKAEKRLQALCDANNELFGFCSETRPISDFITAYRELLITLGILRDVGYIREEFLAKVCDSTLTAAKLLVERLERFYKQDQQLQSYYQAWRLSYQDIKQLVLTTVHQYKEKYLTIV